MFKALLSILSFVIILQLIISLSPSSSLWLSSYAMQLHLGRGRLVLAIWIMAIKLLSSNTFVIDLPMPRCHEEYTGQRCQYVDYQTYIKEIESMYIIRDLYCMIWRLLGLYWAPQNLSNCSARILFQKVISPRDTFNNSWCLPWFDSVGSTLGRRHFGFISFGSP